MKYCSVCKNKYDDGVSFCPADGEVLEEDLTSLVGTNLDGQYRIESLLGKGGMGAVYKARHILLGDQVAIKVLPPHMRNNAEWLRRFQREGQAARRFRHPNSVTVYDLRTTADGIIYLVMEYVEGNTLDAELKRRGKLSALEAFILLEPVMSVLNAAHAVGVVHRDLKPENIMIGNPGPDGKRSTKLLDLGIAKISDMAGSNASAGTSLTVAGQILGTPFYMSPEQWGEISRDENPEIDGRADIYSLGAVIYEMVSGKRPFEAATLQEVRRVHVYIAADSLASIAPGVPQNFSNAVMRALAKDRAERPSSMAEFANELRQSLGADVPISYETVPIQPSGSLGVAPPMTGHETVLGNGPSDPVRSTNADIAAPTILTMDERPTPASGGGFSSTPSIDKTQASLNTPPMVQLEPTPIPSPVLTRPSTPLVYPPGGVPVDSSAPGVTAPPAQPAFSQPQAPTARKSGSKLAIIIPAVLAIILVLAAVVGIGGWYLYSRSNQPTTVTTRDPGVGIPGKTVPPKSAPTPETVEPSAVASVRYWIEPTTSKTVVEGSRLTGEPTLGSGDEFRFHFGTDKPAFIYIVGTGPNNSPLTFLTSRPFAESGGQSNSLSPNSDFVFPGRGAIGLDKKPGTEVYTVIVSQSQLAEPRFLAMDANRELKGTERSDYDAFITRNSANSPVISVNNTDQNAAYVSVRSSGAAISDPIVFQIRLQHR